MDKQLFIRNPSMIEKEDYQPIENYGIIGNLHTVALVGVNGSIDFMCFPRFDSPSVFAAIIDRKKGGYFDITPVLSEMHSKQLYLPDTNVLLTRFLSDQGVAEITDFMPVKEEENNCTLIRRVTTVKGKIQIKMRCNPRFDYARAGHSLEQLNDYEILIRSTGKDGIQVKISGNIPLKIEHNDICALFYLSEKQSADFVFEILPEEEKLPSIEAYTDRMLKETLDYWKGWVSQSKYTGRWREMVNRSSLTLKLLTSHRFGSVVAAPTFGLPEAVKGIRNWDYRYTWIRDAAFTMYAFIRLGFTNEAEKFISWIKNELDQIGRQPGGLQLMYGVDGHTNLNEEELPHLEGYKGSSPVRIGNAAYNQLQLDIYGELMDCIYLYNKYGGPITYEFWENIEIQINYICENWHHADHGIWEVRNEQKEFLYSRVMCWVALDRAMRLAEMRSFPAPVKKWRKVRDEIFKDIYYNFWNDEIEAFVQYKGSKTLDASALIMPLVRIVSPYETKWQKTLKRIEKALTSDSLVYRYHTNNGNADGLDGEEGTFSVCSFWYVEALSRGDDVERARFYFEKMLGYANHLGLYAEQLGTKGEQLGNFPQAFTHLGLISAAIELDFKLSQSGL